ncbi:MAG: hypothetical protein ACP5N3_03975 [Candidatus Nanoarchaeia archaeon]
MDEEEYELVSHEEVEKLKKEIERLKSNPFIQNSSDDKLYDSVRALNESVNKLYSLFENINRQLMKEYQSGESPEEKIDRLLEQNKIIAESLVAFGLKSENAPAQTQQTQAQPEQFTNQEPQFQQSIFNQSMPPLQPPATQLSPPPRMQPQAPPSPPPPNQFQNARPSLNLEPNYPSPDRFTPLNVPPKLGEPISIEPQKKKGLFGK